MVRLTVHLKQGYKDFESRTNSEGVSMKKEIFRNTFSFKLQNMEEAEVMVGRINDEWQPFNNVKKWYVSNMG